MLDAIFGNENTQKVLLFLFIHKKCYGTQLQRFLQIPLTSLQYSLNRLEEGGIIVSHLDRKTKIYQRNLAYPLMSELEELLKKAYMLLPFEEQKLYFLGKSKHLEEKIQESVLLDFWDRLNAVRQFTRLSHSRSRNGHAWNGKGEVVVNALSDTVLVFHEKGAWEDEQGQEIHFNNTFRWTLDRGSIRIGLEHLRLGPDQPVFLFYLTPIETHRLASVDSHVCKQDVYFATVPWNRDSIQLNWRVIGPKKNEEMECCYTFK
jgi:hypothetical protein